MADPDVKILRDEMAKLVSRFDSQQDVISEMGLQLEGKDVIISRYA